MMVKSKMIWQIVKLHVNIKNSFKHKIKMKWPLDDATNLKENTKNQKELLTLVVPNLKIKNDKVL